MNYEKEIQQTICVHKNDGVIWHTFKFGKPKGKCL